ncbi:MAG: DNA-binding protein [Firmicutes bacterium HGW-Firmicutes-12]|jgi:hypothetical protein|nr:MAG: DNA-binding protein [Firmicutes bacterium HGW-Firmicutes-12]
MDEIARRTLLFDFYGPLLTNKQQDIFDLYYQQDLSLGEIAEIQKVSRPAVFDLLRRVEDSLNTYESKLFLVQRYIDYRQILEEMKNIITIHKQNDNNENHDKLLSLLNKLDEHW